MSLVNEPRTLVRALVLVGSSTPWKIEENAAIAHKAQDGVDFMPMGYFGLFHSAVEDRDTALANLKLKMSDVEITANDFRKGGSGHNDFMAALKTNDIRFVGGNSNTAMRRTYILADDTTTAIPKDIWAAMLPTLKKYVVADSLKASSCSFEENPGVPYMSVADIGPILSSIGPRAFFQLVQDTAQQLPAHKNKPIIFFNQVSCAVTCLGNPKDAPFTTLTAHSALQVRLPSANEPLPRIPTSESFSARVGDPTQSLASDYEAYLLGESPRKKIYNQLLRLIQRNERRHSLKAYAPTMFHRSNCEIARPATKISALKIVQPSAGGSFRKNIDGLPVTISAFPSPKNAEEHQALIDSRSMDFRFTKDGKPEHPDAIIFAPFDINNDQAHRYNLARLRDALVAKALNPALTFVPLVIMNYNGCYNDALNAHMAYANTGYNKEFVRPPVFDNMKPDQTILSSDNVEHIPFQFCDVLNSNDWDALDGAVFEVLTERLKFYHRAEVPQSKIDQKTFQCGGSPKPPERFGVTVFASASSDKKADNDNAVELGAFLRALGASMCTGGGDQHTMGSLLVGYDRTNPLKGPNPHVTCVSTHDIVTVETIHGQLPPESDYWELHRTIGPRIETLLNNDLFISVGGGDGTGQETSSVIDHLLDGTATMRSKKMIFIGQNPSLHEEIASILGSRALEALKKNPYALKEDGIYLFPNTEAAKPLIRAEHKAFYALKAQRSTSFAAFSHAGQKASSTLSL